VPWAQAADVPDAPAAPGALVAARRRARAGWYAAKDAAEAAGRSALEALTGLALNLQFAWAWLLEQLRVAGAALGRATAAVWAAFAYAGAAVRRSAAAVRERLPGRGAAGAGSG